jgi:hypothetical protein
MTNSRLGTILGGVKLDLDLECAFSRVLVANNREIASGEGLVEEDPSAQWQLNRCRGIYDIFTLDMFRKRVESLEGLQNKEGHVNAVQ